ncbi:TorF family putative porin [Aquariibacter albus]|uniref:Porin n=1 Tax=Aquariibacter albus TaxID=2759899 RepID=A0A839HK96_9BURK|nr:TorF family putative porin [Aquariibacter albus]MBB1162895.1 hypothetical protein [Aquariibacter albus]
MKLNAIALAAVLAAASFGTFAAEEAKSDWTITGNAGLFSDYRFRGISQTDKKPAFQGGFDIAHSSGFYVGNWNSNIDSEFFNGSNLEMDFYGGYKTAVGDISLDFGGLYYYYPNSDRTGRPKIKNFELYAGASYGTLSAKVYYPISDFFSVEDLAGPGAKNAAGSYYLDLSGSHDLGMGFGLVAHVGYQKLKGAAKLTEIDGTVTSSYVDWKLGVTYSFPNGFVAGLSYIDTNRDYAGVGGTKISGSTAVLSLAKTF